MRAVAIGKLFAVMAVCTVYFLAFARIGALAYEAFRPNDGRYGPGTSVGPVSIAGMTLEEARQKVVEQVNEWRSSASIPVRYQEKKAELPTDVFTFRAVESTKHVIDGRSSPLFVLADMTACMETMERLLPAAAFAALDMKALEADLEAAASRLAIPSEPLDLARYLSTSLKGQSVVSEAAVAIHDEGLARFLAAERRIAIHANQLFSLRTIIQEADGVLSERAVDALASAVYRAALSTNFLMIERYAGSTLPNGIPPGFEAKVDEKRDLQWFNPNSTDYTLLLRYDGRQVKAMVYGWPFAYQYIVRTSTPERIEPRKIVQYDARLAPDETVTKQTGRPGLLVKVEREVRDGSRLVRKETVSEDFYPPTYTVEVRGLHVSNASPSAPEETGNEASQSPSTSGSSNSEGAEQEPAGGKSGGEQGGNGQDSDAPWNQSGESGESP
ncbi:vanW like family protein [Geobacillus kaustophilus]|uniref:VanW like family protein n=1 Tax=Geobacillus kaustophilus TaxID=1462 RepID=A0A0D8BZN6_GEOKU|nr:G5 domain-containing protein [Geobacillus kaustophilus]KJE28837.1 vanW like family protein [Geobacillus kaustophilus]